MSSPPTPTSAQHFTPIKPEAALGWRGRHSSFANVDEFKYSEEWKQLMNEQDGKQEQPNGARRMPSFDCEFSDIEGFKRRYFVFDGGGEESVENGGDDDILSYSGEQDDECMQKQCKDKSVELGSDTELGIIVVDGKLLPATKEAGIDLEYESSTEEEHQEQHCQEKGETVTGKTAPNYRDALSPTTGRNDTLSQRIQQFKMSQLTSYTHLVNNYNGPTNYKKVTCQNLRLVLADLRRLRPIFTKTLTDILNAYTSRGTLPQSLTIDAAKRILRLVNVAIQEYKFWEEKVDDLKEVSSVNRSFWKEQEIEMRKVGWVDVEELEVKIVAFKDLLGTLEEENNWTMKVKDQTASDLTHEEDMTSDVCAIKSETMNGRKEEEESRLSGQSSPVNRTLKSAHPSKSHPIPSKGMGDLFSELDTGNTKSSEDSEAPTNLDNSLRHTNTLPPASLPTPPTSPSPRTKLSPSFIEPEAPTTPVNQPRYTNVLPSYMAPTKSVLLRSQKSKDAFPTIAAKHNRHHRPALFLEWMENGNEPASTGTAKRTLSKISTSISIPTAKPSSTETVAIKSTSSQNPINRIAVTRLTPKPDTSKPTTMIPVAMKPVATRPINTKPDTNINATPAPIATNSTLPRPVSTKSAAMEEHAPLRLVNEQIFPVAEPVRSTGSLKTLQLQTHSTKAESSLAEEATLLEDIEAGGNQDESLQVGAIQYELSEDKPTQTDPAYVEPVRVKSTVDISTQTEPTEDFLVSQVPAEETPPGSVQRELPHGELSSDNATHAEPTTNQRGVSPLPFNTPRAPRFNFRRERRIFPPLPYNPHSLPSRRGAVNSNSVPRHSNANGYNSPYPYHSLGRNGGYNRMYDPRN